MPSFMVKLKSSATPEHIQEVKDLAVSNGGSITHEYNLIKAFAVTVPDQVSVQSVAGKHPEVEHVEEDQGVSTQAS